MTVVAPLIPALSIDLSELGLDATMLRLHFTNWSNIDYDEDPSKFTDRTSVWTDFQTGSNWTSHDANLVDIGFDTIGDLLEELQIDPAKAFDNQLIIIVPNTAGGELGVISQSTTVAALTNYEEGNIYLRTDNGNVIGFHIEGSVSDDEIITKEGSDRVKSSLGDDIINLGENGSTGNWWTDRDTVEYSGNLNVFDRLKGTYVKGYSVTQNEDGSVSVTDLLGDGVNDEGTDTLHGVEELQFGDGEWMQLSVRESINHWGNAEWRVRQLNIDGGVFDDVITGTAFRDNIHGRSGDDVIIADGGSVDYEALTISGGNAGDIARDAFGNGDSSKYDGFKYIDLQEVTGLSKTFDGKQQRVHVYDRSDGSYQTIETNVAGQLYFYTNAASDAYDLTSVSTEAQLAQLVSSLRASGENTYAEVFAKESTTDTYYLLDVTVSSTFQSGDWIEGGAGNDFIDGGLKGTSTENPWENWNKSYYESRSANFEIKQITYAPDAAVFNDGTNVADLAATFSIEASDLAELIDGLGFKVENTNLIDGETITFVGDMTGELGLDILKNIQHVGFSDQWLNLEVTVQSNNWSEEGGYDIQGTIFSDLVIAGHNDLKTQHFSAARTWVNTQAGNDIIITGDSSDAINPGSGYDFIDAGLNTTGNDRWQKADEVRFDGSVDRFDVEQITYLEASEYLNFEGRFALGSLSIEDILGDDETKIFFKISDKAGDFGLGETVLTGVERLSFKGENLWTATSYNEWVNTEQNHNQNGELVKGLNQGIGVEGSQFSDLVKLSEYDKLLQADDSSGWRDLLMSSRGYSEQEADAKVVEYTERLHEFHVRMGAGDDILVADTGDGINVRLGAGNDIAIASPSIKTRSDGAFEWITESELIYDGKIDRYSLTKIEDAGYILNDGVFVKLGSSEPELESILFDLTDLSDGIIKNARGHVIAENSDLDAINGLMVIDRLPEEFGGQGIDLVFGFDRINFEDGDFRLETEVEIRNLDWLRDGNVYAIDVRMKDGGGYFNALDEIGKLNEARQEPYITDVHWLDGSDENDFVVGSNYFNQMSLGKGDDVFITLSSDGESEGVTSNPWDYYDKARFSGIMARYEVEQIFVKVVKDPSDKIIDLEKDENGEVVFYNEEDTTNGIYSGVKVADKLGSKGDGTDILVGIDVLDFSDNQIKISERYEIDINDRDYRGTFTVKFGVEEYVAPIFRQEGSIFGDTLIGVEPTDEYAAFYKEWDFVDLDAKIVAAFIDSGAVENVPVIRDWDQDGLSTPVGLMSEIYADPYSEDNITTSLNAWTGRIYFDPSDEDDPTIIKNEIEIAASEFLTVLNQTNSTAEQIQLVQSQMISGLAELFYVNEVTNIIELRHEYGSESDGDFTSISFPMFDEYDEPYMAPAYSDGEDRLIGRDGDDLIIGNGGIGRFEPGRGDDIIFGSTDQYDVNIDPYADEWNRDRVEYRAESARFDIKEYYGFVDLANFEIIGGVESLVESFEQLGNAPVGASVKKVLVVSDTIEVEDLNLGTDYLINVDQVEFQADSTYIRTIPIISYRENDWIPDISNSVLDGKLISSFDVWDTTRFSDQIDFKKLWADQNLKDYFLPRVVVNWSPEGNSITGYEYLGYNNIRLGAGSDVFVGVTDTKIIDHAYINVGSFTDFSITQKVDDLGEAYVEIAVSDSSNLSGSEFGITKLYDFESIWFEQERKTAFLDTFVNVSRFYNRGRVDFETSIFDDYLRKDDFDELKPSGFDQLTWFNVNDSLGDDTIQLDWGFTGFILSYGDDVFDGGDGADYVWTPNSASNYEISFIKKAFIDGALSEIEITHEEFLEEGIADYHSNVDVTGKLNALAPINDVITREEFEQRYTAELFNNVKWNEPLITGEPDYWNLELGGPGWLEYNDGYYIKLEDTSANNLHGTDYLSNVETLWFGDFIYDPVQNKFFDTSGKLGDGPYLSYSIGPVSDEIQEQILDAIDRGDTKNLDPSLKAVYQIKGLISEFDADWSDILTAKSELINFMLVPSENVKEISRPYETQENRVDLIDLIYGAKIKGGSGFEELYQTHLWQSELVDGSTFVVLAVSGRLEGKNTVARFLLSGNSDLLDNIETLEQLEATGLFENITSTVDVQGFRDGDDFDINNVNYIDRWVRQTNEVLARDTNAYLEPSAFLDPEPIISNFGGKYELSDYHPHFTRAIGDQIITEGYQWVNFSDDSSGLITWNGFADNSDANIVIGTDGFVTGRLLDDLADGGVNFTRFEAQKTPPAKLYELSGFSYSGSYNEMDVYEVSGAIQEVNVEIYGSSDLVLGSAPERGINNPQADISAIFGEIYGMRINGADIDFSKIGGLDLLHIMQADQFETSETVLLHIRELQDGGQSLNLNHQLYLSGEKFGNGDLVTVAEWEDLVDRLINDEAVTLHYPDKSNLFTAEHVRVIDAQSVLGNSNLGYGSGHAAAMLNALLDRNIIEETETESADTITSRTGQIYKVNWEDGIENFNASLIGQVTRMLLSNQEGQIAVRDEFEDGFGDDVYRGGADFYGFENDLVSDDNWATSDTVHFGSNSENFDISIGYLNKDGKISGLSAVHPLYGVEIGSPKEAYVKVADLSTTSSSGFGANYLFDVEMLRFSDTTKWIGSALRYDAQDDRHDQIRLDSYSLAPEFFDAQTNETVLSGFNKQDLSSGDYAAIRFEMRQDTLSDKYFFGLDQLQSDVAGNNWDYDQVRIRDNSWNFDVTPTKFVRNADKSLVMDTSIAVREFDGSEALEDGQAFIEGFVIRDARSADSKKYGDIYISDIEVISFDDNGYSLVKEFEINVGNYDLWLGDNIDEVPMFTWNEYRVNSRFGGLDYTFDGFGEASQSEIDKIKSIDVWSEGMSNDSIVIDTTNYRTYIGLNGGDDYVYIGTGLNAQGSPDYSSMSTVAIDDFASRFEISRVWTLLDQNTLKPLLTNANDPASWILFDEERVGSTEAILISDTIANGYGRKLVIGVGEVDFEDQNLNLRFNIRKEDWDNDGNINRYQYEGTDFDDLIIYLDENKDGLVEDEMRGGKGNDTLVGGKGGDRLNGGQGDDIIFGGENGPSGNWHDNDRLTYWNKNFADLEIIKVPVAVNYSTYEVLRDSNGEIVRNVSNDALPSGYTAVLGTFVTDLIGSDGTDLLIDVEILETNNRGIELNAYSRSDDWNNDGIIDWANIEGTEFNDLINSDAFGVEFMKLDNDFNLRAGDDIVFGGFGGDSARLGAGNDIFIGGENGEFDKWGWQRKDEARFENSHIRYDIESSIWKGSADTYEVRNAEGKLVFVVNTEGEIYRFDPNLNGTQEGVRVATINAGERLTIVTDRVPEIEGIESDGVNLLVGVEYLSFSDKWMTLDVEYHYDRDEFGNIQGSWINATEFSETLIGTDGRDHFNDGAGDDIIVGGLGGDHFNVDGGNDTIYGDAIDRSLDDGDHDTVRFDGEFEQFKLSVKADESGRRFIEVKDLLQGDLGLGINKLYDIENISFSNKWMSVGVRYDYFENGNGTKGTHINGSEFDDDIEGTVDGDSINGGLGNDILRGGDGADYFDGGFGNDIIYGGEEGLNPWGHKDVDVFNLNGSKADYTIRHFNSSGLETNTYQLDGYMEVSRTIGVTTETDTLYGIERIRFNGSELNFVSANGFEDGKWVWKGTDDADTKQADSSNRDERIYGNAGSDTLMGGLGSDDLIGGAGDDILYGNNSDGDADKDEIGLDNVDTAIFADTFADVVISKVSSATYKIETSNEGTDTLYDIEVLQFADRSERLVKEKAGRDLNRDGVVDLEIIYGTFEDDDFDVSVDPLLATTIYGGAGNDNVNFNSSESLRIYDNLGVNTYTASGDSKNDILFVNDTIESWTTKSDQTYNNVTFEDMIESSVTGSKIYLQGFERITFEDSVINLKKTEEFFDVDDDGKIDVTFVSGADTGEIGSELDYSAHSNAVNLNGNGGDDLITGSAFDDVIRGGLGNDTVLGGLGSDVFILDVNKSDAVVESDQGTFTITHSGGEVDSLSGIEAIQFNDGKERLTVLQEDIREYVYGEGFVTTQKIIGNNFDNIFIAEDRNKIITTGAGKDTIKVDVSDTYSLKISDFDAEKDTFLFDTASEIEITGFTTLQNGDGEITLSSEAEIIVNDSYGYQKVSSNTLDYFLFDDDSYSGSLTISDASLSRIIVSASNSEELSWLQENATTTSTHTILNIGTGTVQIDGITGSVTLGDILELI